MKAFGINKILLREFLRSVLLIMFGATIYIEYTSYKSYGTLVFNAEVVLTGVCSIISLLLFVFLETTESSPTSKTVAVIGFPHSGKTTLIVTLFGEIFAKRVGQNMAGIRVGLSGASTIDRVNESLKYLQNGLPIGPTKDKDRFSYQANIIKKQLFSKRRYKVEIGDFPGEDTQSYIEQFGPWLHKSEFFKWTMEADSVVFVIDCLEMCKTPIVKWKGNGNFPEFKSHDLKTRKDSEYVAQMSSAIRAAWQHLSEYSRLASEAPRRRHIILAFTKLDVLVFPVDSTMGNTLPKERHFVDAKLIDDLTNACAGDVFGDLVTYLKNESDNLKIIGLSPFLILEDERKAGFAKLFEAVLP